MGGAAVGALVHHVVGAVAIHDTAIPEGVAVADGDPVVPLGGILEVVGVGSHSGHLTGGEGAGEEAPVGLLPVVADGGHAIGVERVGREAGQRVGIAVHREEGGRGGADGAVLNDPLRAADGVGPRQGGRGGRYLFDRQVVGARTGAQLADGDVVQVDVGGAAARTDAAQGHIAAVAGVVGEAHDMLFRGGGEVDSVDSGEGGGGGRVRHYADYDRGRIGAALAPEAHLHCVHREVDGVDFGEDHHRVGGIATGGTEIVVECLGAGVGVGRRGIDVGVVGVGARGVVDASPAGGQGDIGTGGVVFGVEEHGQRTRSTQRGELLHERPLALVGGRAVGADIHVVVNSALETRDDGTVGRGRYRDAGAVAGAALDTLNHEGGAGCIVGRIPSDGGAGGGDVAHRDIADTRAGGDIVDHDVVNIGIAVASGGGAVEWRSLIVDGYVTAIAAIVVEIELVAVDRESGLVLEVDGVHRLKGGDILRVGHHTHHQTRSVGVCGSGIAAYIHAQRQMFHTVLHGRQRHVAVGCGGRGPVGIEIETAATVDGIGRVRIRIGRGAVRSLVPAGTQRNRRTRAVALEVLGEGQSLRCARRGEGEGNSPEGLVGGATDVAHVEVVAGAGRETSEGDAVGGSGLVDHAGKAGQRIGLDQAGADQYLILASHILPGERDRRVGEVDKRHLGRTHAGRNLGADIEDDVRTVDRTGTGVIDRGSRSAVAIAASVHTALGGIVEVLRGRRRGVVDEHNHQVAAAAVREDGVQRYLYPAVGSSGDIATVDQRHGTAQQCGGIGGRRRRELAHVGLDHIDLGLAYHTRSGAGLQRDAIDSIVGQHA